MSFKVFAFIEMETFGIGSKKLKRISDFSNPRVLFNIQPFANRIYACEDVCNFTMKQFRFSFV